MPKPAPASLAAFVEELTDPGKKLETKSLAKLAERIAETFQVRPDEVAILALTQDGRFLRFVVPEKLQEIGRIPLTSTTALAARTAREKRPEIVNHFSNVPHASVFEAVPLSTERGDPIQKIMSAPILIDRKAIGVIQVCRKGKDRASTGVDFVLRELRELIAVAEVIARCVAPFVTE